ncbi:MAG: GerMN domain-containing protein [Lachnospiraceae bacterium]|nr:GerMN domain-containing protein [Lachnospiraceae bacterium]
MKTWKVYFPNGEYSSIISEERRVVSGNSAGVVDVLLAALSEQPADKDGVPAISEEIRPIAHQVNGPQVVIDFPAAYLDMDQTREILVRASVVETLTQAPEVVSVAFLVEGAELKDGSGNVIGDMNADSFINNTGVELNSYARTNVTLYFTDINGVSLKRYDEDLVYNTNIAMEKFAVETLIGGPSNVNEQDAFPTLSPEAKLLSVTIKDRIAYANFDASVREKPYNVSEDVALYSIVNTLTSLPGIDQVQISIEGSTEGVFMENMKLDSLYERNDELIR